MTRSGTVNAGGFVASTLGISDDDFKAGRRTFRGNGSSAGVSNAGTITVDRGGYAALLGGKVENLATISVPTGKVGLGAAEQATLDLSGDGFLQVAVPSSGSDITLASGTNDFSTVVITGGNNVAIVDANALTLGSGSFNGT